LTGSKDGNQARLWDAITAIRQGGETGTMRHERLKLFAVAVSPTGRDPRTAESRGWKAPGSGKNSHRVKKLDRFPYQTEKGKKKGHVFPPASFSHEGREVATGLQTMGSVLAYGKAAKGQGPWRPM